MHVDIHAAQVPLLCGNSHESILSARKKRLSVIEIVRGEERRKLRECIHFYSEVAPEELVCPLLPRYGGFLDGQAFMEKAVLPEQRHLVLMQPIQERVHAVEVRGWKNVIAGIIARCDVHPAGDASRVAAHKIHIVKPQPSLPVLSKNSRLHVGINEDEQINILNQALAKQPNAILIAACDSGALDEQMITARDAGIPVIAYDITFDNAPEGSLTATSASDSILAAGQAADELLKNETVVEKIKAATPENPAVFSVIAPDAIMTVHRDRTSGFANRMYELCQEWQPGAVAITGNDAFAKDSEKDPAVIIRTDIAASRADEDIRNLAQSVVSDSSVLAIFCVNEASATGILSATSDGLDLDRTNGKYKDLIVIGFDSGSTLNNAVRSGYFYGAVAQDPYTMGYEAMMMAVNVLQGGEASDIVIPAVWFDASNMDDPEISRILYD